MFNIDAHGMLVSMNPVASTYFGMDPESVEGIPFFGGVARAKNSFGELQVELFAKYVSDPDKDSAFTCEVLSADGEKRLISFSTSILYDSSGEVQDITCIGLDRFECGERDDIGEALGLCFENARILMTVTDENGVIKQINTAGAKLFGREPKEMVGHVFTDFLPEFERAKVLRLFKRDFGRSLSKDSYTMMMGGSINKITSKDGLRDILFYKSAIKIFGDGKNEGVLNTAVDITDIVNTREDLRRHQEQLEQLIAERSVELEALQDEKTGNKRLTALGQMADVVSQEIRTPLSTISNSLFVISERLRERDIGARTPLGRALRAIRRCYDIVHEFREFSKNESLSKMPVHIDAWLGALIDEATDGEPVPIIRELTSGLTTLIDPERMKRAIECIMDNGRKAISGIDNGSLTVRSKRSFNRLEIEIEDNGEGIHLDIMEKIFEPLYTPPSTDLGFGMSVCKHVLQAHGGGLSIESREKAGTRVLLWVPVED